MNEFVDRLIKQIKNFWGSLENQQKYKFIAYIAIIIILLSTAVYFVTRPTMVPIYDGGAEAEATAIRKALDDGQIPYESEQGGLIIKVDQKNQVKARDVLISADLPSKGYTYEDAYKVSMAESEMIKREKLKQAKENELERTLERLANISEAKVLLELPNYDRLYQANVKEARASMILTTDKELNRQQIGSVVAIALNGVDGLKEQNLTVADQDGRLLFGGDQNSENAMIDKNLETKIKMKKAIEDQVASTLLRSFDDVEVIANINVDNNKHKATKEVYINPLGSDSQKGYVNDEKLSSKNATNTGNDGAAPGIDSNPGETQYAASGSQTQSESNSEDATSSYLYNKSIIQEEKALGEIVYDTSSIAITVVDYITYDQKAMEAAGQLNGQTWDEFKEVTKVNVFDVDQKYVTAIINGTGINKVEIMGIQTPIFIDDLGSAIPYQRYWPILVVALFVILLAYIVMKGTQPVEVTEIIPELSVEELLSKNIEDEIEEIQDDDGSSIRKEIERFVEEKPEAAAQLLRNWLNQDWE